MQSRRRQQSEETLLNEIFENIVDACIKFDKHKIFVTPVKQKDAPNYYDIILHPIDLTSMKNKAKRSEYLTRATFMEDVNLLKSNAETYNGQFSHIAVLATQLVGLVEEQLHRVENDVANYELLVREKVEKGFIKIAK